MQEDPGQIISRFLAHLKSGSTREAPLKEFLTALTFLPLDLPLLQGLGDFLLDKPGNRVQSSMESRYRRIAFVQEALGRIDFSSAKPGTRFEEFVFAQSDFSIYEKIDAETFECIFINGLDDLSDAFFGKTLRIEKKDVRKTLSARYKHDGTWYVSDGNPFLIPIMRSIHTSLDFSPFPGMGDIRNDFEKLLEFLAEHTGLSHSFFQYYAQEEDDLYLAILEQLNDAGVVQKDGTRSRFLIGDEQGNAALFAVFNPGGKAFTKLMAASRVPFAEIT